MEKFIYKTKQEMGASAAASAAEAIKDAIENKGRANIILATGTSQIEMLKNLVTANGIDWPKVTMFHLDEYIALGADHPASFRKFLKERFVDKVPGLKAVHFVNGDADDPQAECQRVNATIATHPIDVALIGIGENGHLAFNDPPADFETEEPFIIVELDEKCRNQQLGEGWFDTLEQVPRQAISMSIRQIMKSACLIVTVPDKRKAEAVRNALEGQVTPMCPASILQEHKNCKIFLDAEAASLLSEVKWGMKMAENQSNKYSKEYSEEGFWKKVKKYALKAGKEVIEKALMLFYCLQDKDTPKWAKGVIVAALGYFICPVDAIPDVVPVVGFADDLGVLVVALAMVAAHIKEEHKQKAKETLKTWFGDSE